MAFQHGSRPTLWALAIALLLTTAVPAQAKWYSIVESSFACSSKEFYKRMLRLAASKDMEARDAHMVEGLRTQECRVIDKGTEVYREDSSIEWGGVFTLFCVRPRGETECYWLRSDRVLE